MEPTMQVNRPPSVQVNRLDPDPAALTSADETPAAAPEMLTDELLVEEISIDGMCGVY